MEGVFVGDLGYVEEFGDVGLRVEEQLELVGPEKILGVRWGQDRSILTEHTLPIGSFGIPLLYRP